MTKADLRREMRARLKTLLTAESRAEKSRAICAAIARHPAYAAAQTVAIFDAMPTEPHVEPLWELMPRRFVYPRIHGEKLLLVVVPELAALPPHATGVRFREPAHSEEHVVEPAAVDLILVPGLAFTRDGHRLGRGGGFYDRLLSHLRAEAVKLGVCFAEQLVEHLPTEPHDMRVDAVIADEP